MTNTGRHFDWLHQAQDDLDCANDIFKAKRYTQCCFLCQQGAEKAAKALGYFNGADIIRGHSITSIFSALKVNGELEKAGKYLDRFYISARYPDAYPAGYPSQYIEKEDAEKALISLESIFNYVNLEFHKTTS